MRILFTETKNTFFCKASIKGKKLREPFTLNNAKTTKTGQLIHNDVCDLMEENSLAHLEVIQISICLFYVPKVRS